MLSDTDVLKLVDESPTLSEGSKIAYAKQLRSAQKALDGSAFRTILLDPSSVEHLGVPLATRVAYTNALHSLFKRDREYSEKHKSLLGFVKPEIRTQWGDLLKRLHVDREALVDKNGRSAREVENWVTSKEWEDMDLDLLKQERGSPAQLLVAFMTRIPPPRGGDLAQVRIADTDDAEGDLLVYKGSNPHLLIRNHKSRRKYGPIRIPIPDTLVQDVYVSLKDRPREYLFTNSQNEMYPSRDAFMTWKSNTLKRLFKRDVTSNMARREFATAEDMNAPLHSLKRSAAAMGHSVETHHAYRVVPESDSDSELRGGEPLRGGAAIEDIANLTVGKEYRFKWKDMDLYSKEELQERPGIESGFNEPVPFEFIGLVTAPLHEVNAHGIGLGPCITVQIRSISEPQKIDGQHLVIQPGRRPPVHALLELPLELPVPRADYKAFTTGFDRDYLMVGQLGRAKDKIEAANIGKIAEFMGYPDAERQIYLQNANDRGREGDPVSMLRKREVVPEIGQNPPNEEDEEFPEDEEEAELLRQLNEVRERIRQRDEKRQRDGNEPDPKQPRLEGGGFFSDVKKYFGFSGAETSIQSAIDPRDLQKMCEQAYALFSGNHPVNVGKWDLIKSTREDLLYRHMDVFVVAVRGTQGAPSGDDWSANRTIPFNGLSKTLRCESDLALVTSWKREFPFGTWYATGHSLGGAICDELLRAGLVSEAYTFNPAVQTKDFDGKLKNRRVYARGDPLYQLFGRFTTGSILQPASSLAKELLTRVSPTYFATNALDQHNLSAFNSTSLSGGMAIQAAIDAAALYQPLTPKDCLRQSLQFMSTYYPRFKEVADDKRIPNFANLKHEVKTAFFIQGLGYPEYPKETTDQIRFYRNADDAFYRLQQCQELGGGGFFGYKPLDENKSGHVCMFVKDPITNLLSFFNPIQSNEIQELPALLNRVWHVDMRTHRREDGIQFILEHYSRPGRALPVFVGMINIPIPIEGGIVPIAPENQEAVRQYLAQLR
jgi:integrase